MENRTILIIEDHSLTRFGLKAALESSNRDETAEFQFVVFDASTAKKGIEIVKKESVDLILMDLGLPDMDGIEATSLIKKEYPAKKIVILSSHEQEEDVIKSLKAGANAYCTKNVEPEKLIGVVNTVLKGAAWFDPKVAQYVLNAATNNAIDEKVSDDVVEKNDEKNLTTRETQVLELIVDGMTNSEIAKKLDISVNTTKIHVCNILQKLGVQDRTQAAIKALKNKII